MFFLGLSEWVIKKIHEQERKIRGTKNIPHNSDICNAKLELEQLLTGSGTVNMKYAKETITALDYAKNHYHYLTNISMLEAIIAGQRIVFNDYL